MKELRPGMLCLAIDPDLTTPQECVLVEFVRAGQVYELNHDELARAKVDHWRLDRDLGYSVYADSPCCEARYLIPLEGDQDQFRLETTNDIEKQEELS